MAEAFLKVYPALGPFVLAEQAIAGCLICAKANSQFTKKVARAGRPWAVGPFQRCQVDFTEMPRQGRLKYLLVIVWQLTGWSEAFLVTSATIGSVIRLFF